MKKKGFTLIEVLASLVILVIILSAVTNSFSSSIKLWKKGETKLNNSYYGKSIIEGIKAEDKNIIREIYDNNGGDYKQLKTIDLTLHYSNMSEMEEEFFSLFHSETSYRFISKNNPSKSDFKSEITITPITDEQLRSNIKDGNEINTFRVNCITENKKTNSLPIEYVYDFVVE